MLTCSHCADDSSLAGRLVMSSTVSGFFPSRCPMHPRGLRHQRETGGLAREVARDEGAGDRGAFFQVGPADRRGIFQRGKRGEPGSGTLACTAARTAGWLPLTLIR